MPTSPTLEDGHWHAVRLNRPDGPYSATALAEDFGSRVPENPHTSIVNHALRVTFPAGQKIAGLLGAHIPLGVQRAAALEFRVRYPREFEEGLHGKQLGLFGGAGYTGGLGAEASRNGDGWSIRLQFDSHGDTVTNCLYVYHCGMQGDYGEPLVNGTPKIILKRGAWSRLRLLVRMQSAPATRDGVIEVWQDDVRRIALNQVQFVRKEAGRQVDHVTLDSFCGGGGRIPTRDNHVEFADLRWWRPAANTVSS
jgi:hypothetical protein